MVGTGLVLNSVVVDSMVVLDSKMLANEVVVDSIAMGTLWRAAWSNMQGIVTGHTDGVLNSVVVDNMSALDAIVLDSHVLLKSVVVDKKQAGKEVVHPEVRRIPVWKK